MTSKSRRSFRTSAGLRNFASFGETDPLPLFVSRKDAKFRKARKADRLLLSTYRFPPDDTIVTGPLIVDRRITGALSPN
jgi:hypothetical protein